MDSYQEKILALIKKCDDCFFELKLDKKYKLYYYTIFTKSEDEYNLLVDESSKYLRLIDSNNGPTFEKIDESFLPKNVRFFRIRHPDSSKVMVGGDVLGENLKDVLDQLNSFHIKYQMQERPDNKIITIYFGEVAIFFPERHFLVGR